MTAIFVALIAALASISAALISARQGKKISETHKQVSVNSHSSDKPTVLDMISDLQGEVRETNTLLTRHIAWHLEEKE
jgi:hypothetical protein